MWLSFCPSRYIGEGAFVEQRQSRGTRGLSPWPRVSRSCSHPSHSVPTTSARFGGTHDTAACTQHDVADGLAVPACDSGESQQPIQPCIGLDMSGPCSPRPKNSTLMALQILLEPICLTAGVVVQTNKPLAIPMQKVCPPRSWSWRATRAGATGQTQILAENGRCPKSLWRVCTSWLRRNRV